MTFLSAGSYNEEKSKIGYKLFHPVCGEMRQSSCMTYPVHETNHLLLSSFCYIIVINMYKNIGRASTKEWQMQNMVRKTKQRVVSVQPLNSAVCLQNVVQAIKCYPEKPTHKHPFN